jgi:hypothetical protein
LVLALVFFLAPGSAVAAPAPRGETGPPPEPEPGQTRAVPYRSPDGLVLHGSDGYEVIVGAEPAYRGRPAQALVEVNGAEGALKYTVRADLRGEGIRANFGRFGRIDLRWVPDGGVREVRANCGGLVARYFFATGAYIGSLRFRGGDRFTEVRAHRIRWRRSWYPRDYDCPVRVFEGFPGPGTILEAGHAREISEPIHLDVIQNHAGERVAYQAMQSETAGRVRIVRYAFVLGGPKTITVAPDFRTAEISPPAPFSGTGRFERTEHARGTWLGDLAVEFPDHRHLRLTGRAFEAVLHSGFHEQSASRP